MFKILNGSVSDFVMFWLSVEHKVIDPFTPADVTALCPDREWWAVR